MKCPKCGYEKPKVFGACLEVRPGKIDLEEINNRMKGKIEKGECPKCEMNEFFENYKGRPSRLTATYVFAYF
ncbi:hypothetical protein VF14_18560 [Nostoc linckia z18]|uniref:Uncharacterized protein n=2 Tax=Nostoc linckia TaxID=92942 RepID=A0A9Q5Z588_NOSLI|nr:hypothetical protein [Nostoc linckia]PHJ81488.1 hypothetical protein VF04_37570 [Nostoc linckia z7]PHJ81995.1 hypothetical protein VF07_29340 [Nostoc linckia z6]PHK09339.1 hypothetical protein VF09_16115 [Nostoc linckia z9]PHJ94032.1 hypothetical protein VF08_34450 [Nostoc linckia z8]PHK33116.1 hypothetical protein VF14_18560 [Nostoc linckia z18]